MKKKFTLILLTLVCVIACAFGLAACGSNCEHRFGIKYDVDNHWQECEKCFEISRKEPHNTDGLNGECSSCKYKPNSSSDKPQAHDHVWASVWSKNETSHWHACEVSGCTEKNNSTTHSFVSGTCTCGYTQGGGSASGEEYDSFNNVSVSANGVLSWNKIKGASKYVLKVTYAAESESTDYTIEKTKNSVNLNELRGEGFPAGKSSVEILVYENVEVKVDGRIEGYQEVLMTDVKESFRIVKSNGNFTLVRLTYSDANVKLNGFYAEKQTIENKKVYLYERVLNNNQPMKFKINDYVKAADSNHTVNFYKSEAGRNSGDSSNIWNSSELIQGYPQISHGANFYYITVVDKTTGQTENYDLCVYGLYTLTVKRYNVTFTENNGLRGNYTKTQIGYDMRCTEMDIVPQDVLYSNVDNGKLARTADYKPIEKEDLTILSSNIEVAYYFYDESTVRADCQTYDKWSKTYNLREGDQGWYLSCDYNKASGTVQLPNILMGKKVLSATFDYSPISSLMVAEGAETLVATFTDCNNLLDIFLPSTITTMRKNSFQGVNSNVTVHCAFAASVANTFPLRWDYDVNKKVKTEFGAAIPENALTVSNGLVFSECENKDELAVISSFSSFNGEIPAELEFNGKTYKITQIISVGNVDNLTIGKNINYIADGVLDKAKTISVASGNSFYSIASGILYCNDFTSVVRIIDKSATQLTIDSRVQNIPLGLLSGCSSLQSLTIPFVGASASGSENTHFGYIFGATSYLQNSSFVPATLRTVTVKGGNEIKDYAFYNCNNLTSITIPLDVTSIGSFAFYGCSNLTSTNVTSSLYARASKLSSIGERAFYGCSKLASITIPSGVTSIGNESFYDCSSLTSITVDSNNPNYSSQDGILYNKVKTEFVHIPQALVGAITIPDTITSIGEETFNGCNNLSGITVGGNNPNYSSQDGILYNKAKTEFVHIPKALVGAITIPATITSIGQAFSALKLTSITFGENSELNSIGASAFYGCNELQSITIPSSVTSIGTSAFSGCSKLASITIDANSELASIGDESFYGCNSLTSITIPSSVTSIGASAFSGCSKLASITIDANSELASIGERAFSSCNSLKSITIPSSVTSIGSSVFASCNSLTSITFGENSKLTSIGNLAFNCGYLAKIYCGNIASWCVIGGLYYFDKSKVTIYIDTTKLIDMTNITIPSGVTNIGNYVFENCYNLQSITISDGVTNIGNNAFFRCWSLKSVTIPGGVKSIGASAFMGCSALQSITIAENSELTSIGASAFKDCRGLVKIDFKGTLGQWQAITKGTDWDSGTTAQYTLYCTNGSWKKN